MISKIFGYLRDRWPFSHAVQAGDIEKLVRLCGAEPWHIFAVKSRIWRRHVCIACNWVADCTEPHECVFEPGCGSGANLLWLAQTKGFSNLRGNDLAPEAVKLCHMLAAMSGVDIGITRDDALRPTSLPRNIATILSVAMMLRHSFGLAAEAAAVERSVGAVLADGYRTADIARAGETPLSTAALGDAVAAKIK